MADHTATLAVNLEDGTSAPALNAAKALEQLQGEIKADTKALGQMQRAMKNLQGGTSVNIEQYKKLQAAINAKKQAISQAQSSVLALGGGFSATAPKAGKVTSLLEKLTQQASAMPGPMGSVVSQFSSLGSLLAGGAIAVGILAIGAALVALVAAGAAAIAMLTSYGIAQANARRNEHLRLEGLTKMRFWYRAAAGSATELQKTIDQVADNSSVGRGELTKYTEQLYKMGLRGDNLSEALEGVAIKAATQGDAAAQAFAGMAAGAALSGRSVKAMADVVRSRLGGLAAAKLLDLDVQLAKMRESFGALFRDVKLDGFLTALREVLKVFSQASVTGRALKLVIEGVVQMASDGMASAAPYIKRFFQGMVIGALLLAIVFLKLRNAFRDTFADSKTLKGIDGMTLALNAGLLAVSMLVAAVLVLGALIALPFIIIGAAIWGIYESIMAMYEVVAAIDWGAIGSAIVWGIVNGLKLAAKAMISPAVLGVATLAWDTFRSALGISSPSKEFAKLGLAIPQGVAAGVEQGTPAAQGAVGAMVEAPGAGGAAGGGGARGPALTIGELHFHAANDSQPRALAEEFRHELERVLAGLAVSLGAPVPEGA